MLGDDLLRCEAEKLCCLVKDELWGDGSRLGLGHEVGEDLCGSLDGDGFVGEAGERGDAYQCSLEDPDVVRDVSRDELEHLVGDVRCFELGLLAKDGQARFELWGLDIGDQALLEPASKPVFDADLVG
jgi:hypothetical protein